MLICVTVHVLSKTRLLSYAHFAELQILRLQPSRRSPLVFRTHPPRPLSGLIACRQDIVIWQSYGELTCSAPIPPSQHTLRPDTFPPSRKTLRISTQFTVPSLSSSPRYILSRTCSVSIFLPSL
ncbi:hypothetical protein M404DRAFT_325543 [Pisolithus tinctorius Marx 270]|uniref:Uncharacterized protein n=1 Tax=Pisolithus tinctorius Marx 270 TaxID=870435 RepID=A0A0C3KGQ6_PISTI|nr:hypothetical protein M404DRAFT_325543 [Pisolithus tinctorius Marx 270]